MRIQAAQVRVQVAEAAAGLLRRQSLPPAFVVHEPCLRRDQASWRRAASQAWRPLGDRRLRVEAWG